jgi:hypothetical protein
MQSGLVRFRCKHGKKRVAVDVGESERVGDPVRRLWSGPADTVLFDVP